MVSTKDQSELDSEAGTPRILKNSNNNQHSFDF